MLRNPGFLYFEFTDNLIKPLFLNFNGNLELKFIDLPDNVAYQINNLYSARSIVLKRTHWRGNIIGGTRGLLRQLFDLVGD